MIGAMRENAPDTAPFDRNIAGQTALKRIGTADEVGELVLFPCSDSARNVTGTAIPVDGGKAAGMTPGMIVAP